MLRIRGLIELTISVFVLESSCTESIDFVVRNPVDSAIFCVCAVNKMKESSIRLKNLESAKKTKKPRLKLQSPFSYNRQHLEPTRPPLTYSPEILSHPFPSNPLHNPTPGVVPLTGTTSQRKPFSLASMALRWERVANSSCSALLTQRAADSRSAE